MVQKMFLLAQVGTGAWLLRLLFRGERDQPGVVPSYLAIENLPRQARRLVVVKELDRPPPRNELWISEHPPRDNQIGA